MSLWIMIAGLLLVTILPELDQWAGLFSGFVGYYAVDHVGLVSAEIISFLAGVGAWAFIPLRRRGLLLSGLALMACISACVIATLLRVGVLPGFGFASWGELLYVVMVTFFSIAAMGFLKCLPVLLPRKVTVFLSSTTQDLQQHRDIVYRAIEHLDGFTCTRMEDFGARATGPEDYALTKVDEADIFIGILGQAYGSCPPGKETSFTESEINYALLKKKPCLMFLSAEDGAQTAGVEDPAKQERLRALRDRVNRELLRSTFTSPDDLAKSVVAALYNWERRSESPRLS